MNYKSTSLFLCKTCHNVFQSKNIEKKCFNAKLIPCSLNYFKNNYNFTFPCKVATNELKNNPLEIPKSVPHPH